MSTFNYSRPGLIASLLHPQRAAEILAQSTAAQRAASIWTMPFEYGWEALDLQATYITEQRILSGLDSDMRAAIEAAIEGMGNAIDEAEANAVADAVEGESSPVEPN
jgi:hypothetical protein